MANRPAADGPSWAADRDGALDAHGRSCRFRREDLPGQVRVPEKEDLYWATGQESFDADTMPRRAPGCGDACIPARQPGGHREPFLHE